MKKEIMQVGYVVTFKDDGEFGVIDGIDRVGINRVISIRVRQLDGTLITTSINRLERDIYVTNGERFNSVENKVYYDTNNKPYYRPYDSDLTELYCEDWRPIKRDGEQTTILVNNWNQKVKDDEHEYTTKELEEILGHKFAILD